MPISSTYSKIITIPEAAIDENGHVNNVVYVQWMQDIAVEHYATIGGIQAQGPMQPGLSANIALGICFLRLQAKKSRSEPGWRIFAA